MIDSKTLPPPPYTKVQGEGEVRGEKDKIESFSINKFNLRQHLVKGTPRQKLFILTEDC
jgi:hypothetical protein